MKMPLTTTPIATAAAASIVLALCAASSGGYCPAIVVDAFSPAPIICSSHHTNHISCTSSLSTSSSSPIVLRMSEEESTTAEDSTAATSEGEESPEEEAEPKLDPEVVALKEQITSLESDLKAKKTQLNSLKEMVDKYSSAGYAREVAKGQNNQRLRGANMADNKMAARASVLQSFVPVLDELDEVGRKYQGNSFASTLDSGLRSELENSLMELGVKEYTVEVGDAIDGGRVVAIEEEYSEEAGKGTILQVLKTGLEISGNVVRPAEVVGSLGSENTLEEEGKEEEVATEGGDTE